MGSQAKFCRKGTYQLPPKRLLIVCTRRIGDVLFVTPLVRTFKRHWPDTRIDLLVFKGTEAILKANTDIYCILTIEEHPSIFAQCCLLKKIFRVYDLAISTLPGDKATLYACLAANYRIGMLSKDKGRWWKRFFLSEVVEFDNVSTHTVLMNLRLAEILRLKPFPEVVVAWNQKDIQFVSNMIDVEKQAFAVLHIHPKFPYKEWIKQGWVKLANWLQECGYTIVFTGDKGEKETVTEIANKLQGDILNMVGHLSLSQVAFLLSYAKVYVGPDTIVTHMAAALGVVTIALFGPSNPIKWGPWPKIWPLTNPFVRIGDQRRNNVYLIQGPGSCVPCFQEGCEQHVKSRSRCLEDLTAQRVIDTVCASISPVKSR